MAERVAHTPLYDRHVAAGARMVPFAGFAMPVQYTGVIAEHLAVRERVGLFDVSHMGEVVVSGPEAVAAVDAVVTNAVGRLRVGRAMYTVMCTPEGGIVDDLIVYRLAEDRLLLCVNAANRDKDFAWVRDHVGSRATVEQQSDAWAQLALQGPAAADALAAALGTDAFRAMRPFRIAAHRFGDVDLWVATTGYTGSGGYELYVPAAAAGAVWDRIVEAGGAFGMLLCGLGARDTLRLEMGYCLYGADIDETTSPLEAGLDWVVKFSKGPFVGREALEAQRRDGVARKLVGFVVEDRRIARAGHPIVVDGRPVGRVTSGTRSPSLKRSIGLGYVPVEASEPGTAIEVEIRGRRVPARVVRPPFVRPDGTGA